jgi:hypothetical protein
MQQGDCLILSGSPQPRGIGEYFFQTRSKEGEIQDVILLVRIAQLNAPDEFAQGHNSNASDKTKFNRR